MYKNLKTDADRLSSPFDIHATLMDILKLPTVKDLQKVQTIDKHSLSLSKEIPKSRTCKQVN